MQGIAVGAFFELVVLAIQLLKEYNTYKEMNGEVFREEMEG